jgi:enoyl-CoA hydratase/carnithine racemase
MEMLLTGDPITAVEAAQKGMITQSLESSELAKYVLEKANKIGSKSSKTLKRGKGAYYRQREMPLDQAYEYTSQVMVENMLEQDAKEGIDAFIEKRTPQWEE